MNPVNMPPCAPTRFGEEFNPPVDARVATQAINLAFAEMRKSGFEVLRTVLYVGPGIGEFSSWYALAVKVRS